MGSVSDFAVLVLAALMTIAASDDSQAAGEESIFKQVKNSESLIKITDEVNYVPPMMIIGFINGTIARCPVATPRSCEVYHVGDSSVTATAVHGEFLFASLHTGTILRCHWQRTHSCSVFHQADSALSGLAVAGGFIHAGLETGSILKCDVNTPGSCKTFADAGQNITALAASDSHIYAGADGGTVFRCVEGTCSFAIKRTDYSNVEGLTVIGDQIYSITSGGTLFHCHCMEDNNSGNPVGMPGSGYRASAAYGRKLYASQNGGAISTINLTSGDRTHIVEHSGAVSISFAYGTHAMQDQYQMESEKCIWSKFFKCPPTVAYYGYKERLQFEVFVKNGSLYDWQGGLVDTSSATETCLPKSAMFVMGPDGQILLSHFHKTGYLHTSSLLAGSPVSGAGRMVVDQGKIRSIVACSAHYRPDRELNDQVIDALYLKGYTDPINSQSCTYTDTKCALESNYVKQC